MSDNPAPSPALLYDLSPLVLQLLDVLKPWRDREAMGRPPPPKDGMTATIFSRAVEQVKVTRRVRTGLILFACVRMN